MKKMRPKEIKEQLDLFSGYLRERGLKMTRQRELVIESFLEAEGHLSTEELYQLVKEKDRKVGFATVFRTLKALTDCGLAREIDFGDGLNRFEHDYKRPRHHHLICEQCNRTIEFFSPELDQIQDEIVARYDFKPVRQRIQIFGICRDCQAQKEGTWEAYDSDLVFARDALKIAMETEKRGVAFYSTASKIVSHASTRETFLRMLKEEEKHLAGLEKMWDRLLKKDPDILEAPVFLHFDYEALNRIFPSRKQVEKKLKPNLTERDALKLAMEMEKDAHNYFREYAEKFNDTRGRDIFLKFASEEEDHYNLIKDEYDRLEGASRSSGR